MKGSKQSPADTMKELRDRVFALSPGEIGVSPSEEFPNAWGVVMELGYPQATVTLLALAEGTTSLYFSTGGGVIGSGKHETVRKASKAFIAAAGAYHGKLPAVTSFPCPDAGRVRFYILTFSGVLSSEADEKILAMGKHEMSPLYMAGQDVLTQMRLASEKEERP